MTNSLQKGKLFNRAKKEALKNDENVTLCNLTLIEIKGALKRAWLYLLGIVCLVYAYHLQTFSLVEITSERDKEFSYLNDYGERIIDTRITTLNTFLFENSDKSRPSYKKDILYAVTDESLANVGQIVVGQMMTRGIYIPDSLSVPDSLQIDELMEKKNIDSFLTVGNINFSNLNRLRDIRFKVHQKHQYAAYLQLIRLNGKIGHIKRLYFIFYFLGLVLIALDKSRDFIEKQRENKRK